MPRRRGRPAGASSKSKAGKKWDRREDIPLDEVDEFHEQRDKILLEGEAPGGDSDGEDEEVFALNGLDEDDSDIEGEGEYEDDEDEIDEAAVSAKPKKNSKSKSSKKPPPSESEHSSESEEEESWGQKKSAYYSSNAAQLESDDEEAHDMEEQEARRLQAKLREGMRDDDYAFSDALNKVVITDKNDDFWNPPEKPAAIDPTADKATVIRNLQKTSPETLALAQEWDDIARAVVKAEQKVAQADSAAPQTLGMLYLHHQTVLTYATVLAFYLYLRASPKYAAHPELLRLHPIFKRLLVLKQTLANLEDLQIGVLDSDEEGDDEDEDDEMRFIRGKIDDWNTLRLKGLEDGELSDLISNLTQSAASRKNEAAEQAKKKKATKEKKKSPKKIVYDVEEPTLSKSSASAGEQTGATFSSDPFGEATSIGSADAADKSARKKALRFHAARIESTSNRRQNARNAMGGDEDIPYKERRKEAEKRKTRKNLGEGGEDLDDADPEPLAEKRKRSREEIDEEESDDDGYYSLVKKQKSELKKQKKAVYDAEKEANRMDFDDDTPEGQRGISRAMMANRGLTPKRAKANRNPRVKKKLRFEKAKKKLSSQKAVYKGGIGDVSRYGGETSGISKVVKSVSF